MRKATLLGMVAIVAGLAATPGAAQSLVAGQGVADRPRPDYDPLGDRVGAFTMFPTIDATVNATDNYLATDTGRQGDVYLTVQPAVDVRSNWSRNMLEARAFFSQSVHADLSGENTSQFGLSSSGALDVSHDTQLTAGLSAARYVESRSSLGAFQGSVDPVHYEAYHAGVGASHSFLDLVLNANAGIDYRNYHDTFFPGGIPIDQDYRDVRDESVGGSAKYSLRNGLGLIVTGQYDQEHYPHDTAVVAGSLPGTNINRDSSGFNIQGGVTLELTKLIYGYVQIGYISRHYVDPQLENYSGLSYSADVLWNVTTLTSLHFRASRSVQDTSSPFVAGNIVSDFSISVDHELYRNLILSGQIGYERFRPNGIGIGGDEYYVSPGARYLINRRFSLNGGVRYDQRTSASTFLRYHAVSGYVGARVAF